MYVQGEIANQTVVWRPPVKQYHVFCSTANPGATALMRELGIHFGFSMEEHERQCSSSAKRRLYTSSDGEDMPQCDHFLLYLTDLTWTSGDESTAALANDVLRVMEAGVHMLLAHEMPGVGQEERFACPFANFFACDHGATPQTLLHAGVYNSIATPLKGGAWRQASMIMLAHAIQAVERTEAKPRSRATAPAVRDRIALQHRKAPHQPPASYPAMTASSTADDVESSPHVTVVEHLATFDAGPLGLGISCSCDGVIVSSVDNESAASAQSVRVGDVVIAVSGQSTRGLSKDEVLRTVVAASRPLTLLLARPESGRGAHV